MLGYHHTLQEGGTPLEGSTPPEGSTPVGRKPPRKEAAPQEGNTPRHTVNARPVRILLECILVSHLVTETK